MRILLAAAVFVHCLALAVAEEPIIPAGAELECLYTRSANISGGLTEGPATAPDGSIYFTDIPIGTDGGLIVRFDPQTGEATIFTDDSGKANGLVFDFHGRLIACEGSDHGGRCVSSWNVETGERTVLCDNYQGKRFNAPNDLTIDGEGRIYFTDPRYLGDEPRELEHRAVYRLDPDGAVTEITHDVEKPNGIGLSPDCRTLYVADHNNGTDQIDPSKPKPEHGAMKIYAFPLDEQGLVCGDRRTLVDFGHEAGCDGLTVDCEGRIYLTCRSAKRPGVMIIDGDGHELAFLPTGPENQTGDKLVGLPSNVCFGRGAERSTLYVTIDLSLYRIQLNAEGSERNP